MCHCAIVCIDDDDCLRLVFMKFYLRICKIKDQNIFMIEVYFDTCHTHTHT